jgi:hypothetical protein
VFSIFLYIFAVVAMNLFSGVRYGWLGFMDPRNINFDSWANSLMLMFRFTTGDNFNGVMRELMVGEPYCTPARAGAATVEERTGTCGSPGLVVPFFVALIVFSTFILVNLVAATVLEAFEETSAPQNHPRLPGMHRLTRAMRDAFLAAWAGGDPSGMGFVGREALVKLVLRLPHPLGLRGTQFEKDAWLRFHAARARKEALAAAAGGGGGGGGGGEGGAAATAAAAAAAAKRNNRYAQSFARRAAAVVEKKRTVEAPLELSDKARYILARLPLVPFFRKNLPSAQAASSAILAFQGVGREEPLYHIQAVLFALLGRANGEDHTAEALHLEGHLATNAWPDKFVSVVANTQRRWRRTMLERKRAAARRAGSAGGGGGSAGASPAAAPASGSGSAALLLPAVAPAELLPTFTSSLRLPTGVRAAPSAMR